MNHQLFLCGVALRHQQRNCRQRVVVNFQFSVSFQVMLIALQKPDKQESADAFIAIRKRMILDDEIQQMCGLLLNAGVKKFSTKRLQDIAKDARKAVVLLIAEQRRSLALPIKSAFSAAMPASASSSRIS